MKKFFILILVSPLFLTGCFPQFMNCNELANDVITTYKKNDRIALLRATYGKDLEIGIDNFEKISEDGADLLECRAVITILEPNEFLNQKYEHKEKIYFTYDGLFLEIKPQQPQNSVQQFYNMMINDAINTIP